MAEKKCTDCEEIVLAAQNGVIRGQIVEILLEDAHDDDLNFTIGVVGCPVHLAQVRKQAGKDDEKCEKKQKRQPPPPRKDKD